MGTLKKRALIFGSAPVRDWSFLALYHRPDDLIICADGGRNAAQELGLTPDWYVGDSDSGGYDEGCPSDILPSEKDVTDLDMAVSRALREGCNELVLCGCTGGRQDHHFSAIGQLERLCRTGADGVIVDEQNEIRLLVPGTTEVPSEPHYRYFGLIPLDQQLTGVTIIGAKYEVSDSDLERWSSLGVSNELVPGRRCVVKIKHGVGLLIRSN